MAKPFDTLPWGPPTRNNWLAPLVAVLVLIGVFFLSLIAFGVGLVFLCAAFIYRLITYPLRRSNFSPGESIPFGNGPKHSKSTFEQARRRHRPDRSERTGDSRTIEMERDERGIWRR